MIYILPNKECLLNAYIMTKNVNCAASYEE